MPPPLPPKPHGTLLPPGVSQLDSWTFIVHEGYLYNAYRLCPDNNDGDPTIKDLGADLLIRCYDPVDRYHGPHTYTRIPRP